MKRATLKSLAKATGFSVTTISRALGGFDDVNEETRRFILEEARRQGYEPNLQARLLQGQRSQTVGLIIPAQQPHFSDPFFSQIVSGVGNEAAAAGFDLLVSTHPPTHDEIDTYRRMVAGLRVDGLILTRTRIDDARINYLLQTTMPFVVFGRTNTSHPYAYIDVDGVTGQREMTEHFIALGHRRIAYISPPTHLTFSQLRIQGFRQAMNEHHLPIYAPYLIQADLSEAGGYQAAEDLLDLPEPPTAIMAGNDLMALGVMSLIRQRGLQVGEDIAVGGFDDIPAGEHVHPTLTTIHQPIYEIGRELTQMLLQLIEGQTLDEPSRLLVPHLIIRGSSGSLRHS